MVCGNLDRTSWLELLWDISNQSGCRNVCAFLSPSQEVTRIAREATGIFFFFFLMIHFEVLFPCCFEKDLGTELVWENSLQPFVTSPLQEGEGEEEDEFSKLFKELGIPSE